MILRPTSSTRTATLFPFTTIFRSQPQLRCAASVWRVVGVSPNTARDSTNSGMRSNSGLSHHIASHAIQIRSPASAARLTARSEEHTSELQSLMRHSYAVFCLKKNKKPDTSTTAKHHIRPLLTQRV